MKALGDLIEAKNRDFNQFYGKFGKSIGKLYTDFGLPIDMSLDKLKKEHNLEYWQLLCVLDGALQWLIEHRRNSNATDKAIERQQKINRKALEDFVERGETGIY